MIKSCFFINKTLPGVYLHVLDRDHLVKVFLERPQLSAQYPDLLLGNLNDLDITHLVHLAEVLDPSKPVMRGFIMRKLHHGQRTSSLTSLTGSGEFSDTVTKAVSSVNTLYSGKLNSV